MEMTLENSKKIFVENDSILFAEDAEKEEWQSIAVDENDYRYVNGGSDYRSACEAVWGLNEKKPVDFWGMELHCEHKWTPHLPHKMDSYDTYRHGELHQFCTGHGDGDGFKIISFYEGDPETMGWLQWIEI